MNTRRPGFTATRLRRLAQSGGPGPGEGAVERCELCAEPLPPEHRHLLAGETDTVACACRACALLFEHRAAPGTGYRALPRERRRLAGCVLDGPDWAALGVPVSLAFFVRSGTSHTVSAAYPSPLGLLRSPVDADSWRAVERCHPALPALADDVEALLVDRADGAHEYWIVPVDDCYRLAALVRAHFKGLGGGPDVRRHVDGFFRSLATQDAYRPAPAEGDAPHRPPPSADDTPQHPPPAAANEPYPSPAGAGPHQPKEESWAFP